MIDKRILLLFLAMSLVTYIPRALPVLLLGRVRLSGRAEKFLRLIPYTAMSALVVPGVLGVDPTRPWLGLAGAALAAALAWRRCPVVLSVLAAVAAVYLLMLL